jgi:hypothetical protein
VNDLDRYMLTADAQGQLSLRHLGCDRPIANTISAPSPLASRGELGAEPTLMDLLVAVHAHRDGCDR